MRKNQEIEVLRAVAILFVLMQHLCVLVLPKGPLRSFISVPPVPFWDGVDLFFCISGYVIALGLYPQLAEARGAAYWKATSAFWLRRFYRIVPSTSLWIVLWLLCVFFFNRSQNFGLWWPNVADAVAALLNLSNWHIFSCVGQKSVCGPNPIYWSLSLEEQFYFLLPLILLLPRRWLTPVLLAIIAVQLPWRRAPWEDSLGGALWFVRTDALLLGALIGIHSRALRTGPFVPVLLERRLLRWAVSGFLLLALVVVPKSRLVSFDAGAVAATCAALVYIASFDRGFLMPDGWLRRILVWIGTRSFSLYLIHIPTYYFVAEWFFRFSPNPQNYTYPIFTRPYHPIMAAVVVTALLMLAELNYRIVEVPFREKGRRRSHRSVGTFPTEVPILEKESGTEG